jgi:hypothetical protein
VDREVDRARPRAHGQHEWIVKWTARVPARIRLTGADGCELVESANGSATPIYDNSIGCKRYTIKLN